MKYHADIEPRHLRFVFKNSPKYWHSQSPIKTYHFNALALFLPILEKLVVLSLKKATIEVKDPILKAQVVSLVSQEAIHGREFHHYNQAVVTQHFQLSHTAYNMKTFRILSGMINKLSHTFHYALSAAGEHFTAISADLFLRQPTWFEGMSADHSAIWRWHCIEEIEHKSVAFDVYQTLNGSYILRIMAMLMITAVFCSLHIRPIWQMMKKDGKHKKIKFYIEALQYYWGKKGLYSALLKPYFDYFRPSFHPRMHQNEALITQWKAFFKQATKEQIISGLQYVQPFAEKKDFKQDNA